MGTSWLAPLLLNENVFQIRDMSSQILHEFFPWPLPLPGFYDVTSRDVSNDLYRDAVLLLMGRALELCSRTKTYEADAGAKIIKLIYDK